MITLSLARIFYREAIRERILNLIWIFALAMMGLSLFMGDLSAGEQAKVVTDFGLGVLNLMLVLVATLVGTSAVHKEIEKRTAYVVLSKPVARWQFMVGKWLGLAGVLGVLTMAMGAAFFGLLWLGLHHLDPAYLTAIGFMYVESLVVAGVALFFGSVTNPTLSALYVLGLYVVGHNSEQLLHFDVHEYAPPIAKVIGRILYYVLPNFSAFNLKNQVVYGHGISATAGLWALVYGLAVMAVLLIASAVAFAGREL